jgi:hypothetical protein
MSKARRPKPQRQTPTPLKTPPGPPPADLTRADAPEAAPAQPEPAFESAPEPDAAPVAAEQAPPAVPEIVTAAAHDEGTAAVETAPAEAALEVPPASLPALPNPSASAWSPIVPRFDAGAFGTTVVDYMIGEGNAFAAHMRALAGARSVGEVVRLQIGEFQRAADATLTCWGSLTVAAGRTAAAR